MNANIICIGDELITGVIEDTNSSFISRFLCGFGIITTRVITVGDSTEEIVKALDSAKRDAHLVFVTGGLGSTHDDLTKDVVSDFFNSELVFSKEVFNNIRNLYKRRNKDLPEVCYSQAYLPDKSDIIPNSLGTAQGMHFHVEGADYYILPGVPVEMKEMLNTHIAKSLRDLDILELKSRMIHTSGYTESQMYTMLQDWIKDQKNVKISFLPRYTGNDILVRAVSHDHGDDVIKASEYIESILGDSVYGFDDDTIEKVVGELLLKKGKSIAAAESCTGGLIGHRITNVSGSSQYFMMGVTTYSNESKMNILNVKKSTLENYGAVSQEIAIEMAQGVRKISGCDIGLSTTGKAGPIGGNEEKVVGTIYIGISTNHESDCKNFIINRDRIQNKFIFSQLALNQLRLKLLNY